MDPVPERQAWSGVCNRAKPQGTLVGQNETPAGARGGGRASLLAGEATGALWLPLSLGSLEEGTHMHSFPCPVKFTVRRER